MNIKKKIQEFMDSTQPLSQLEEIIKAGDFPKMKFSDLETFCNTLFSTNKYPLLKLLNSYYSKLVGSTSMQFFHLKVLTNNPSGSCRDMIQNYKCIFSYNRYIDCSGLLSEWSPTESYFPLLVYIHQSNPDIPIDYTYWLKRFSELPTALKFLKDNSIPIEFTEKDDLKELYKTIPEQYIKDFLDLLGTKSWYIDVIKDTDHFLEEIEEWES